MTLVFIGVPFPLFFLVCLLCLLLFVSFCSLLNVFFLSSCFLFTYPLSSYLKVSFMISSLSLGVFPTLFVFLSCLLCLCLCLSSLTLSSHLLVYLLSSSMYLLYAFFSFSYFLPLGVFPTLFVFFVCVFVVPSTQPSVPNFLPASCECEG